MPEDIETRRKRLLWRATHRGTRELDLMIGGYARACLKDMTETQLDVFEDVLNEPEPVLQGWLLDPRMPTAIDDAQAPLIGEIRRFHGLAATAVPPELDNNPVSDR